MLSPVCSCRKPRNWSREARLIIAHSSGKTSDADSLVWSHARLGKTAVPVRSLLDAVELGMGARSLDEIGFTGMTAGVLVWSLY